MKLVIALALPILQTTLSSSVTKEESIYHPHKFSFKEITNEESFKEGNAVRNSFVDVLSNVGMLVITEIPGYEAHKKETISWIHECAMESSATQDHTFPDGTVRRTMATHTVPGPGGMQKISHKAEEVSSACEAFRNASEPFRETVSEATQAFADMLGSVLDTSKPLLSTKDGSYDFDTIAEVTENGEHLEHFHSYQLSQNSLGKDETIEMHTDQGLFLAFTPGAFVNSESKTTSPSDGFYIELKDGSRSLVEFDSKDEGLVFMLGDGVNQYVNAKVESGPTLRATPHTLTMPKHGDNEARVWYGRMVLPPGGASHPQHGKTFEELRQKMIDASLSHEDEEDALSLGCSSTLMARQLEETTCAEGSTFCWHRCMEHSVYAVSDEICAEKNLNLRCVNPRDQLYVKGHGDYYPACTNSTQNSTEYPKLPQYPRDEENCSEEKWEGFASSSGYDHVFDLEGIAKFMWSVKGGTDTGTSVSRAASTVIDGRLTFNGIFGYLALGFAKEGGKHNGMNGASIIMALPGGNYSAMYGLDLSLETSVKEYVIDPTGSAFRHWKDPLPGRDTSSYKAEEHECFTALSFSTDNINDIKFNFTGTDKLIWGANPTDYYAGYHGRKTRHVFVINWATGEGSIPALEEKEDEDEDGGEAEVAEIEKTSGVSTVSVTTAVVMSSLAGLVLNA